MPTASIARGIVRRRQSTHGSSRITDELRSLRRTTCFGDSTGTGEKWYSSPEDSSFSRLCSPRVCSIFTAKSMKPHSMRRFSASW